MKKVIIVKRREKMTTWDYLCILIPVIILLCELLVLLPLYKDGIPMP